MAKINFSEYGISGKKRGICPKCGKMAVRSKRFYQTLNPFNKNKSGEIKTIEEILKECNERLSAWRREPVYHAKCVDQE
jgi:hypothetical protein